jgi:hypothetical protein
MKMRDLGLTYEQAAHGVQTAIAFDMENGGKAATPKHLRVGVDMSKADMLGLTMLLISKGIITQEEYAEHMRLAANEELAMREEACPIQGMSFR